uniref:Centrosomal protein CCDC61 n=1 Tax=Varanus komodoensis TaxID=61221 RepID=A0A8D2LHG4_VARKO
MAKLQGLQADCVFRGVEHVVRLTVEGNLLEVEVEDRLTTDQWRGEFDAAFIEDLTHKTGNFKQFGIFCSMLESALAQSSESVTLDLLTYADLESLRSRKMGVGFRHLSAPKSSPLNAKRYLILIYSVEFDRIHYPLPLPYVGKPDPIVLQKVIRELKEELATLKGKPGRVSQDMEIRQLREELQRALEEKQEARLALRGLEEERKLASKSAALKEVQVLKKLVQSLEEELAKERAKHQRLASKRLQENRQLAGELAELKATERTLRIRLKNLTSELALFKKGHRPTSGERSNSRERSGAWGPSRPRSTSREGCSGSQGRLPRQSPSPTGARAPRFDPTAFVKAKERKQKEAEQRKYVPPPRPYRLRVQPEIGQRRSLSSLPPACWPLRGCRLRGRRCGLTSRPFFPAVESFRSRRSSASSGSEMDDFSEPGASRYRSRARGRGGPSECPASSGAVSRTKPGLGPLLTPEAAAFPQASNLSPCPAENLYDEPSADLSEIDARLQALQEYMNKLETRT